MVAESVFREAWSYLSAWQLVPPDYDHAIADALYVQWQKDGWPHPEAAWIKRNVIWPA